MRLIEPELIGAVEPAVGSLLNFEIVAFMVETAAVCCDAMKSQILALWTVAWNSLGVAEPTIYHVPEKDVQNSSDLNESFQNERRVLRNGGERSFPSSHRNSTGDVECCCFGFLSEDIPHGRTLRLSFRFLCSVTDFKARIIFR
jgi:hypothetical protein